MSTRKPPYPWVRVVWLDAFSEDPWLIVDDYVIHDQLVHSEGYLVRENERYVMLAPNVAYNHEDNKWEMFGAAAIPRDMMRKPLKIIRKAPTIGGKHVKKKAKVAATGADVHSVTGGGAGSGSDSGQRHAG